MAALLDNYSLDIQEEFLERYAGYGYTHLQRSLGHALGYGHSIADFTNLCRRAQQFGLFSDVWMIANESPGFARDQNWSYWQPLLQPIIDQLLAASAIDSACVAWQMDQMNANAPGNATISIIAGVAEALPPEIPVYTHWMNEALAWWKTGGELWTDKYQNIFIANRFDWWRAMAPYLTGGHHQGDTTLARTNPGLYQAKLCDTLNPFNGDTSKGNMTQSRRRPGPPQNYLLTVGECSAQDQFDEITTEDQGDMIGFILMCTSGYNNSHLSGYGNGARMPDGSPL